MNIIKILLAILFSQAYQWTMLITLPDVVFPVTRDQSRPLLENVVQLNSIYAGLDERTQKAIGIVFKTFELLCDTDRKRDYTGSEGQRRLMEDSAALVGDGTGLSTRIGDMRAAGLAIDYHNVVTKLKKKGLTPIPADVNELRRLAIVLAARPSRTLDEIGLMISYLRKDSSLIDSATRGDDGDNY